ncbi:hypothetical protein LOD99_2390 [Oopsacas minuta]|uniref:Tetratricopeptide repeat protein 17 n=1 Tax=Oopsacas minuta TaxID=111878 RepID=A0AAV7K1T5_9METZ|nr:hypothetical protein LOD99_2390 [Oopsacas minuta]
MCEISRAELEKMLCPQLVPQIFYCMDHSNYIIPLFHSKSISVLNVNSSRSGVETEQNCDRVTLSLPLCQSCVSWELIFDHTQLDMPPDFTFGDDFIPDIRSLKRLEIYSLTNVDSLLLVLQELFELYRQFNYEKAVKQDRVGLELNMMKESGITHFSVLAKDVPSRSQAGGGDAMHGRPYFYLELPLEVDFKRLPPTLVNPEDDITPPSLLLIFKPPTYTHVQPKLIMSSTLERALTKSTEVNLSLEPWGAGWGNLIIDYLPRARERLVQVVGFVSNSFHKRKEFTNSILKSMSNSVLEFDDVQFMRMVLLMEDRGFCFLVHVTNSHKFPETKPTLTFQSVYHFLSMCTPFHKIYDNYPYSPRWSGEELVHRIRMFIRESVDAFRIASLQGGRFYFSLYCLILCIVCLPTICYCLDSHWIVTQQGKIEQKFIGDPGTFIPLKRPFDLVAFLNQEKRVDTLIWLEDLLVKQVDKVRHLEHFLTTGPSFFDDRDDLDCGASGNIHEFDLFLSTVVSLEQKGIIFSDFLDLAVPQGTQLLEPICALPAPLTLSFIIFDNLPGVENRSSLPGSPEPTLRNSIPFRDKLEEFGHSIATALAKNHTSWVLLNLANLYWRLKGVPLYAIECSRMALHYSPAEHQEIVLVNLANVLHRGSRSQDAAVVMISSIEHNQNSPMSLLTLGNVFSVLGLYQRAAICFNRSHSQDQSFEIAKRRSEAAQCNAKIHSIFSQSLEQAKVDLETYTSLKQDIDREWVYPSERPEDSPVQLAIRYIQELEFSLEFEDDLLDALDIFDGLEFVETFLTELSLNLDNTSLSTNPTLTNLTAIPVNTTVLSSNNINKSNTTTHGHTSKPVIILRTNDDPNTPLTNQINHNLKKNSAKSSASLDNTYIKGDKDIFMSDPQENPVVQSIESLYTEHYFYPADQVTETSHIISNAAEIDEENEELDSVEFPPYNPIPELIEKEMFPKPIGMGPLPKYDDPYWPGKKECTGVLQTLSSWERYPSTHIPAQTRGVNFRSYFRHVPFVSETHAPLCQLIVDLPSTPFAMDHLPGIMYRHSYPELVPEQGLKHALFQSIEQKHKELSMDVSEAGTKLFDAMKKFGPEWGLLALSGIYWRVVGNPYHSMECYRRVAHYAPINAKSVAFIGMANILHRNNFIDDALITAKMAIDYDKEEPIAHYTLAKILSSQGNLAASSLHLRYALRLQNLFPEAVATLRVIRCYLKFDQEKIRLEKQQRVLVEHQKRLEEEQRWLKGEGPKFNSQKKQDYVMSGPKEEPRSPEEVTSALQLRKDKLNSLYTRGLMDHDMMEDQMQEMVRLEDLYEKLTNSLPYNSSKESEPNFYDFRKYSNTALDKLTTLKEIPYFFIQLNDRNVKIRDNINLDLSLSDEIRLPKCKSVPPGLLTLDHLEGVSLRRRIHLPDVPNVLNLLLGEFHKELIDIQPWPLILPYGLSQTLKRDKTNWVAAHLTAQYWLSQGRSLKSIECIRLALYYAPAKYRDIPLMILTNYLLLSGFTDEALITVDMAMEIYAEHPVYYFAKALIYYSQSDQLGFREYVQKAELMKRKRASMNLV